MSGAPHLTLVLGGARAGKSGYAEARAAAAEHVAFVATAQAFDDDMAARIARHRADRPAHWETIEAPLDLIGGIAAAHPGAWIVLDCLTLWVSNHFLAEDEGALDDPAHFDVVQARILEATDAWLAAVETRRAPVLVVSNEIGLGVVPGTTLARRYRDVLGRVNQHVAAVAGEVVLMVAGIPMTVKG